MRVPSSIAIDGPSAAGKSVISYALAGKLGYLYLDTGAMYRAITWLALAKGVSPHDAKGLSKLAADYPVEIQRPTVSDGRQYTVSIDGKDVTWAIRGVEVEAAVSLVSAVPDVRKALVAQQRRIAQGGNVVMVGRDIGTVVLPDAGLKLYLIASPEERARRRYKELLSRGQRADYESLLAAMIKRDKLDSERETSPLRPAADAIIVDTDKLSIEEVLREVEALVERSK